MSDSITTTAETETSSDPQAQAGGGVSPLMLLTRTHGTIIMRKLASLRNQSRLLTTVILLFIASYLLLAFKLFEVGLRFLDKFPPLGILLTERLLFLLFFFLFVLLLLSNLVVSYSNFFRNRESTYLLTLPVAARVVFQWKMIESSVVASWAFVFLVAPLVAAFGRTRDVTWDFYVMSTVMVALFIILPSVLGACLSVLVARYLDRRLFQTLAVGGVLLLVLTGVLWLKPEPIPEDLIETRVLVMLDKLLVKTLFAEWPFWPSHWLSSSVLMWADGVLMGAGFYLLVLLSYVLAVGSLAFAGMGNFFYGAMSAVHSRASVLGRWNWMKKLRKRKAGNWSKIGWLDRLIGLLPGLQPDMRAMMVKDVRMFWRDTTQWAQSLVLFGLLGVYIFNLRHFTQQLTNPFWVHLVAYLNLGACSLNLATLTTRFVYPQFSLEGKRLWIVGLVPMGMRQIIRTKFWLAAVIAELVTLSLIAVSCYMLRMSLAQTLYFAGAITIMTLTLTGLAVGLGALYPNFKEENPSKIVSGFGGTFCLVLSFLYILGSVILLALASPWAVGGIMPEWKVLLSAGGFIGFSCLIGLLPYWLGLKKLDGIEL